MMLPPNPPRSLRSKPLLEPTSEPHPALAMAARARLGAAMALEMAARARLGSAREPGSEPQGRSKFTLEFTLRKPSFRLLSESLCSAQIGFVHGYARVRAALVINPHWPVFIAR